MSETCLGRRSIFALSGVTALYWTVVIAAGAETRTWSDASGKFTIEAEYLSTQGSKVRLRKSDGKEITVAIDKLSEADQQFINSQKPPRPTAAGKASVANDLRKLAETFYADLRTKDRQQASDLLTLEAQSLSQDGKSSLPTLPSPDQHVNAIKPGKPKITGKQAEIPVQVRVDKTMQRTTLHLRMQDENWRVFAISAIVGGEEVTVNFESPVIDKNAADPLAALVGQKFELDGYMLDGTPLDMSKYEGKVVLIDFWATWCGPCRAEMPNIYASWRQYHDAGFEVIAVSVDQDLSELQRFVLEESPPWAVVADHHPKIRNPMGAKYGISGIPQFVLLDADGKVASINCRGKRLSPQVAELLAGVDRRGSKPRK